MSGPGRIERPNRFVMETVNAGVEPAVRKGALIGWGSNLRCPETRISASKEGRSSVGTWGGRDDPSTGLSCHFPLLKKDISPHFGGPGGAVWPFITRAPCPVPAPLRPFAPENASCMQIRLNQYPPPHCAETSYPLNMADNTPERAIGKSPSPAQSPTKSSEKSPSPAPQEASSPRGILPATHWAQVRVEPTKHQATVH